MALDIYDWIISVFVADLLLDRLCFESFVTVSVLGSLSFIVFL